MTIKLSRVTKSGGRGSVVLDQKALYRLADSRRITVEHLLAYYRQRFTVEILKPTRPGE